MASVFDSLERLGVTPPVDTNPRLHGQPEELKYYFDEDSYHREAETALRKLAPVVISELIPNLEQYKGTWHPDGFMVYPLGIYDELGSTLRFHIWPQGDRVEETRGVGSLRGIHDGVYDHLFHEDEEIRDGSIHDHGVRITSLNLLGYQDNLYKPWREGWEHAQDSELPLTEVSKPNLSLTGESLAVRGLFRRFVVDYYPDGSVGLMTYGELCSLELLEHREVAPDAVHTISSMMFHAPTIPRNSLAATLVFHSRQIHTAEWELAFQDQYPAIMMAGNPRKRPIQRPVVTEEQAKLAKNQLMDALASPGQLWAPPQARD